METPIKMLAAVFSELCSFNFILRNLDYFMFKPQKDVFRWTIK
jgi:hypothetical protein